MKTIQVFTANSGRGIFAELVPQFERASGHHVAVSYDPAKVMLERIARGETADVALIAAAAIDDLVKQGKIAAGTHRAIVRCGVGVAVRAGAARPDIGTVEAFKKSLLAAKSVAWTEQGASGIHFSKVIESLGIAAQLQAKAVRRPGGLIAERVVAGEAEIAIQQIPELLAVPGVDFVGPLPAAVQMQSTSAVGIFAGTKEPDAAAAFVKFICAPAALRVFQAKGFELAS